MPSCGRGFTRFHTERGVAAQESVLAGTSPPMIGVEGTPDWCQREGRSLNDAPQTKAGRPAAAALAGIPSAPKLMTAPTLRAIPTAHPTNGRTLTPSGRSLTPLLRRQGGERSLGWASVPE